MSRCRRALDQRFYPESGDNWDDKLFRVALQRHIGQDDVVLDVGAGAGIVEQMNFRGVAGKMCGIDLDPRVLHNAFLHDAKLASAESIPYEDSYFDVVFSDNVLEHLEKPQLVFAEIARVLKPGGVFLFKTPNKRHYMPVIARLTPLRFHRIVNRLRGRQEVDTFPTLYRANSPAEITKLADNAEMLVEEMQLIEGRPEYLRFSCLSYLLGICYERLVNLSKILSAFRILMIGTLRKGH